MLLCSLYELTIVRGICGHADKNKQQLGLQEFLFGISMTQKKTKDRQQKILPAGYHTQPTGLEIIV